MILQLHCVTGTQVCSC